MLIPQLTEIATDYKLDGAWIDGDIWRAAVDYCDEAKKAFTEATGIGRSRCPLPTPTGAWRDFHRQAYRDYANRYIAEVKKAAPDFEFCCNWAFSTHMPEEVCLTSHSPPATFAVSTAWTSPASSRGCSRHRGFHGT